MAHIKVRVTQSGKRYDVQWRPVPGGPTRERTFKRRSDADNFVRQLAADSVAGIATDPSRGKVTVAEVAEDWMKSNPSKRTSSIQRDRSILDTHIKPVLGDRPVRSVTQADIRRIVNQWTTEYKASTVVRQFATLRSIFAHAVESNRIARNPCTGVRPPRMALVERPQPSPADLERLAAALGDDQAPMMWLAAVLGLRWSEAAGLRAGSVDPDTGIVSVVEQISRSGTSEPPKSHAGRRRLAAPDWLIELLLPLMAGREADELIFVTAAGTPLSYTNWRSRVWVPACVSAGLAGLRFHDLRSLAATALVAAGVDVKTAQTRLGHSSPTVTLGLYARATAAADRLAADAVGELYRPAIERQIEEIGE